MKTIELNEQQVELLLEILEDARVMYGSKTLRKILEGIQEKLKYELE